MSVRKLVPIVFTLLLSGTLLITTTAQRPNRQTPAATIERGSSGGNSSSINRTPFATPDSTSGTRERPNSNVSTNLTTTPLTIPTFSLPTIPAVTPRPTRQSPASSGEAEAALSGFATSYLGSAYTWLYTGDLDSSTASPEAVAAWNTLVAQLPAEVQSYIVTFSNVAGGSYWGVFQTGSGMVTVGDCANNPNCVVTVDNLDVYLNGASAGVYASYVANAANSANDALNLVHSAYPKTNSISLAAISTDQGYAFEGYTYSTGAGGKQVQATTTVYIVGVIPINSQSLLYAVVGVGDGYVNLVR
ncbi:MAG: hypothetical protein R3E39_13290 [Anaerolineae bacterium]